MDGVEVSSTYTYDALDRVLSQTNPDGTAISYAYDTANNTITVTNPNGNVLYERMGTGTCAR